MFIFRSYLCRVIFVNFLFQFDSNSIIVKQKVIHICSFFPQFSLRHLTYWLDAGLRYWQQPIGTRFAVCHGYGCCRNRCRWTFGGNAIATKWQSPVVGMVRHRPVSAARRFVNHKIETSFFFKPTYNQIYTLYSF